jgi:hypothetical protein
MMKGYSNVLLWVCCIVALNYFDVDGITEMCRRGLQMKPTIDPMIQQVVCYDERKEYSACI